jgi:hypothetical protein
MFQIVITIYLSLQNSKKFIFFVESVQLNQVRIYKLNLEIYNLVFFMTYLISLELEGRSKV